LPCRLPPAHCHPIAVSSESLFINQLIDTVQSGIVGSRPLGCPSGTPGPAGTNLHGSLRSHPPRIGRDTLHFVARLCPAYLGRLSCILGFWRSSARSSVLRVGWRRPRCAGSAMSRRDNGSLSKLRVRSRATETGKRLRKVKKRGHQFSPLAAWIELATLTRPCGRSQTPKCRCLRQPAQVNSFVARRLSAAAPN
jgi:hypothetical protein